MRSRPERRFPRGRNAVVVALSTLLLNGGLFAAQHTWAAFAPSSTTGANAYSTIAMQPPTALTATSQPAGAIGLTWAASTSAALRVDLTFTYQVVRRVHGSGSFAAVNGAPGTSALTYMDTPPADGSYDYAVLTAVTNFTSANSTQSTSLSDRVAPAVSAACSGALGCAGATSVTITATDAGSGVASITQWIDSGTHTTTTFAPAGTPKTVNVSGLLTHTSIHYFATDAAGNVAATQVITFIGA